MKAKNKKLTELKEEIRLTRANLRLLKKAKKTCTCEGQKPHYHILLDYDSESGDVYLEESDAQHQRFIEKLSQSLTRLESRLGKLKTQK